MINPEESNILIYQTDNGETRIETRVQDETVWLNQIQMSDLFQKERSVITKHINNVFKEGELPEKSNVQILHISGSDRPVKFYSLDVIISVGYRVKSHRGTQFRQWATARLREYLIKGFTMNDQLLKDAGGGNYFDELLQRIRDIRSSEKVFWRKILDIYATSIDYDPSVEMSVKFFKTIQNKMHWAAHGNTAAEIIYQRADASQPFMGLTSFKSAKPTKNEAAIAKNYLNEKEINVLNRIVTAYLEIAELQAVNQKPMYMKAWIERLDDFLKMTGNSILTHAGKTTHTRAMNKVHKEYEAYNERIKNDLSEVERHFIDNFEKTAKQLKITRRNKKTRP
ncbi:MAG: virulence RhuM family protein [Bacteroidales bacterium]|nr:virulence RhuM family protein [Bacteroidales bacterium]